ncbi:MAG: hypothetical protein ACI39U_04930 [Candidatus Cryptobacteroides sp.]
MAMDIKVNIQNQANIFECLSSVFDIVQAVKRAENRTIVLDFSSIHTKTPVLTLPLSILLSEASDELTYVLSDELKDAHLGTEIIADQMRLSAFKAQMQAYSQTDFLPIVAFPATKDKEDEKDSIQSVVENILIQQIGSAGNISLGFRYIIGECIDNIIQHARSKYGYIAAQTNKQKQYLDICIADKGITLLGSYKENNDTDIVSDIEALKAANRGISTKNLPNAENRGYGLITSKKMLTTGLGGLFIMISGSAILIKSDSFNEYAELPEGLSCKGTIVICRMPFVNKDFNYINYVE